ncbi:MAG: NUDIX domain-containing protein [Ruminococcus sp.]|nr:NUDIX domain-containing protein [Ruminococcus sp.]
MELWDLFDRNRKPLGKTHVRGEKMKDGEYHVVVNAVAVNQDNKILITKRHPDKTYGGLWETTGGSAISGETSINAAVRELFEETGLKAKPSELAYCGTLVREKSNSIHDFYLYKGSFSENDIVLQEGETVDFKLSTPEKLNEMNQSGEFLSFVYDRLKVIYSGYININT